jgi:hypothetical protein
MHLFTNDLSCMYSLHITFNSLHIAAQGKPLSFSFARVTSSTSWCCSERSSVAHLAQACSTLFKHIQSEYEISCLTTDRTGSQKQAIMATRVLSPLPAVLLRPLCAPGLCEVPGPGGRTSLGLSLGMRSCRDLKEERDALMRVSMGGAVDAYQPGPAPVTHTSSRQSAGPPTGD